MPRGTPKAVAQKRPRPTRQRLGTVMRQASPEPTIAIKLFKAGSGAKPAKDDVFGLFAISQPPSHQRKKRAAIPAAVNPADLSRERGASCASR
jgi:hypothetical protein